MPRKRIGLSMRKDGGAETAKPAGKPENKKPDRKSPTSTAPKSKAISQGAFGSALADALKRPTGQ